MLYPVELQALKNHDGSGSSSVNGSARTVAGQAGEPVKEFFKISSDGIAAEVRKHRAGIIFRLARRASEGL